MCPNVIGNPDGVVKWKGQGIGDITDKYNISIFSNKSHAVLKSKYSNIVFFSNISNPLFPSCSHQCYLQILYSTNFLKENVFYILYSVFPLPKKLYCTLNTVQSSYKDWNMHSPP